MCIMRYLLDLEGYMAKRVRRYERVSTLSAEQERVLAEYLERYYSYYIYVKSYYYDPDSEIMYIDLRHYEFEQPIMRIAVSPNGRTWVVEGEL